MYDIFNQLLKNTGKKASDVAKSTGIPPSTFSDWKKGKSSPKTEKLQKIADYFDVTINYLMTGIDEISKDMSQINDKENLVNTDPTCADIQQLLARNGNKLTSEEKLLLIKLLSEL